MDLLTITTKKSKYLGYPNKIFECFESKKYLNPPGNSTNHNEGWVTARFSPHPNCENIIFLGDDPGNIGIFNVDMLEKDTSPLNEKQLHFFSAHNGAIMDIIGVPKKESNIVSISGDSTIRCWDLNKSSSNPFSSLFHGHEGSIRSVSFAPDDPNIFVTGGRDGFVKVWDMRVSICRKQDQNFRNSTITYKAAHPIQNGEKSTLKGKNKAKLNGASVTSVVFIDDRTIISASSVAETGIRLWDIRKPTHNGEGHPTRVLQIPVTKQRQVGFGVTCLALDRFQNSLFASCTNSVVFEYSILSDILGPVRSLSGANVRDYYTQVACSPIADMIACGSEDCQSVIWDVQDQYNYLTNMYEPKKAKQNGIFPKWTCKGHESKVLCVGWSSKGNYYMSMDDKGLRIWNENKKSDQKSWSCCDQDSVMKLDEQKGIFYEKVGRFKLSESDDTIEKIDSMFIWSSHSRPSSTSYESPPKRASSGKRLLVKSPFRGLNSNNLTISPRKKISKISNSPLKEISNEVEPKKKEYSKTQNTLKRIRPFFCKFPTENLPNSVYDKFLQNLIGNETTKSLSKTSKKRIEDWWQKSPISNTVTTLFQRNRLPSVPEFGDSACSKVISEQQRNAIMSPKKLVVKSANSTTEEIIESNKNKLKKTNRSTSRNLLHYFNKNL